VERLVDFEMPLGEYVNAFAGESYCEVKTIPFHSGRFTGEVRVLLRVYPMGSVAPTLASQQPTRVIADHSIELLQKEKLIPESVMALEADADIMDELVVKMGLLERTTKVQASLSPQALVLAQRRSELENILGELEAADRQDGGRSQLDSAERHMLAAIELEEATWRKKIDELRAPATPTLGGVIPPQASSAVDPKQTDVLLKDLMLQRSAMQKRLEFLDRQQTQRDVTTEAIEALEALKHLDAVIEETKQHAAAGSSAVSGTTSSVSRDGPRGFAERLLHAYAMSEAAEYAVKLVDALKHLPYDGVAQALEEHAKLPLPTQLATLQRNTRKPTLSSLTPPPSSTAATGGVLASSSSKPVSMSAASKDLDDIFSIGPMPTTTGAPSRSGPSTMTTSAPPVHPAAAVATAPPPSSMMPRAVVAAPATSATAKHPQGTILEDLFGGTAPSLAAAAPVRPAPVVAQPLPVLAPPPSFQPPATQRPPVIVNAPPAAAPAAAPPPPAAAASQPPMDLPKFDVLTQLTTTTTPVELATVKTVLVAAQAVRFVDHTGTKFVRGSRLAFRNQGSMPLTISEITAVQEDIFSGGETQIPCRCNIPTIRVGAGETVSVFLSFPPQASSMQNVLMALLRLKLSTDDGRQLADNVRLKL